MGIKQDELKNIQAQKKALAGKQKQIREELKESATERNEARKTRSESRKAFTDAKSALRTLLAKSYVVLKDGTSQEVSTFADEVTELSSTMTLAARKCSEVLVTLEHLDGEVETEIAEEL